MLRGVSYPYEGSKILGLLFRPRLVSSSLLHLRSSWKGFLRSSETSYYASSIMLGAPRRGHLTSPKSHELNQLVSSDGGLLRNSPRDRVALQHAHLRSGGRLIARSRSGRSDESG